MIKASFYSPNGQFGCFTLTLGRLVFTLGLRRSMAGCDLSYNDRMLFALPPLERL